MFQALQKSAIMTVIIEIIIAGGQNDNIWSTQGSYGGMGGEPFAYMLVLDGVNIIVLMIVFYILQGIVLINLSLKQWIIDH